MLRIVLPLMAVAIIVAGLWPRSESPPTDADRVRQVASRIRCPFCNGESIAEAPSGIARDLEDLIAEQVADGRTNEEIFDYFEGRYGEAALMDPPLGGWGWVLWAAPLGALAVGTVAIVRRRRSRAAPAELGSGDAVRRRLGDELAAVEADVADLDRQLADGEIDAEHHATLLDTYAAEADTLRRKLTELDETQGRRRRLDEVRAVLADHPEDEGLLAEEHDLRERLGETLPDTRRRSRAYAGAAVLLVGAVAASWGVVSAADGRDGVVDVPTPPPIDLENITAEQLEEVVARNPEVVGMRLALANLYFEQGDVLAAAQHYGRVLERERHPEALARLGYISWQVDDAESAEAYLVEALERLPDYPQAQWWLANVRMLALDDPAGAVAPLEALLATAGIPDDVRAEAETLLAQAKAS
jgi:cytochrome c-type biogenesis protein CcmH/NrfF